jgi:hypothetical protein
MRFRRALSALAVTMVAASGLTVLVDVATAPAAEAAVVKKRLVKMTRELKVAREVRRGYDRSNLGSAVESRTRDTNGAVDLRGCVRDR